MTVRADLVVVGAGLAGAAAAYAAADRGLNVVVLEAFGPAHRNGSSHGSARIFRRAYSDPLYVRLTGQSGRRWRALEAAAGESLGPFGVYLQDCVAIFNCGFEPANDDVPHESRPSRRFGSLIGIIGFIRVHNFFAFLGCDNA